MSQSRGPGRDRQVCPESVFLRHTFLTCRLVTRNTWVYGRSLVQVDLVWFDSLWFIVVFCFGRVSVVAGLFTDRVKLRRNRSKWKPKVHLFC